MKLCLIMHFSTTGKPFTKRDKQTNTWATKGTLLRTIIRYHHNEVWFIGWISNKNRTFYMVDFVFFVLATYWNSKYRQTCPITDDSRGITLQSLGGIFLATLVGLLLSMITLAYEVWQQKKKEKEQNKVIAWLKSNITLQLIVNHWI